MPQLFLDLTCVTCRGTIFNYFCISPSYCAETKQWHVSGSHSENIQIEMGILVDKMKPGDTSTSTTEILKWKNCSVYFLEYVTISKYY